MIKRYRCKRTGKEVAAVPSKHTYAMVCEDGLLHRVLEEIFDVEYEEIGVEEELSARVKVTKLPHEFVADENILVRFKENHPWDKVKFVRTEGKGFLGSYRIYSGEQWALYGYAIPYEGNEHLEFEVTNCSSGRWPDDYEFPKPEHEFNPFDRVVVRDRQGDTWRADLFSHMGKMWAHTHMCVGAYWKQCLPYNEKTAKLIGTTDNWEG